MTAPTADEQAVEIVLATFAAQLVTDREAGRLRPVDDYQALYPGYEQVVAQEYVALMEANDDDGAPDLAAGIPERIGPYRVRRELGRGGQSVVYLAQDERLDRPAALKILPPTSLASDKAKERFQREAKLTSQLEHPGICVVYETGEQDGLPWIAMRYVPGETLAGHIATARATSTELDELTFIDLPDADETDALHDASTSTTASVRPPKARLEIMRIVRFVERTGRALHAAHEAGLLHRDVKPGNIIVAPDGEPVLVDFGLARSDTVDRTITLTGDLMGTPAYMSPEQLLAQRIRLDRRSDIYSLGVTLFECLTLTRPFEAATREALYQQILTGEAPDARKRNRFIPKDLKVVIDKSLEKDRNRRYPTALAFAEDLRRVQEYEPIEARPAGLVQRGRRFVRRHPTLTVAAASLFVLMGIALVASNRQRSLVRQTNDRLTMLADERLQLVKTRTEALDDKADALSENVRLLRRSEGLRLATVADLHRDREPEKAAAIALEAVMRAPMAETRTTLLTCLDDLSPGLKLDGLDDAVPALAFDPRGRYLAAGTKSHGLAIIDLDQNGSPTGSWRFLHDGEESIDLLEISPTGDDIAIADKNGRITIRQVRDSLDTTLRYRREPFSATVRDLAFDPTGQRLVITSGHRNRNAVSGAVTVVDLESGKTKNLLTDDWFFVRAAFHPDGRHIGLTARQASGGRRSRIWLVDSETGETSWHHDLKRLVPWPQIAFSPNGKTLIAHGRDALLFFDAETGDVTSVPGKKNERCVGLDLTVTAHGHLLTSPRVRPSAALSVTSRGSMRLWNIADQSEIARGPTDSTFGRLAKSGRYLAVVEGNHLVAHDLTLGRELDRIEIDAEPAFGGAHGNPFGRIRTPSSAVNIIAMHPTAPIAATRHDDGYVRLWRLGGRGAVATYPRPTPQVTWLPAGIAIFEPGHAMTATDFDLTDLRRVAVPRPDVVVSTRGADLIDIHPGRGLVAACSDQSSCGIFDLNTGEHLIDFESRRYNVRNVRFVAEGSRVLIHSIHSIRLVDTESGDNVFEKMFESYGACQVAPDGKTMIASSNDSTRCVVLSTEDGRDLKTIDIAPHAAMGIWFDPSGKRFAATAGRRNESRHVEHPADVVLVDIASGTKTVLGGHTALVQTAVFSSDGRRLFTGSKDGTVRAWNLDDVTSTSAPTQATSSTIDIRTEVLQVDVDAANKHIVVLDVDGLVHVFDRETHAKRLVIRSPRLDAPDRRAAIVDMKVTPDGGKIMTVDTERTLRAWPVDVAAAARGAGIRKLNSSEAEALDLAPEGR